MTRYKTIKLRICLLPFPEAQVLAAQALTLLECLRKLVRILGLFQTRNVRVFLNGIAMLTIGAVNFSAIVMIILGYIDCAPMGGAIGMMGQHTVDGR